MTAQEIELLPTTRVIVRRRKEGLMNRFWSNVERHDPDACWPWKGACVRNGYGQIRGDPEGADLRGRKLRAHRVAFELAYGPISPGLHILHHCDNPGCVNPGHLFLGTHLDNMADMIAKQRHAHGERQPTRKLSRHQVRAIRWLAKHDPAPLAQLAGEFGVATSNISIILNRRTWRADI